MSISSEINRIKTAIADAYESADEKGATLPTNQNVTNLASTIDSITGGGGDLPEVYIEETYNASNWLTSIVFHGQSKIRGNICREEGYLKSITFPTSYTSIGSYSFYKCTSLTNLILPNSTGDLFINSYAFNGCNNLDQITFPSNLKKIDSYAFGSCAKIGTSGPINMSHLNNLTTLGSYAFNGCTKFNVDALPDSLTDIGQYAFYNCSDLGITELPSNCRTYGSHAFDGCKKLKITSLPIITSALGEPLTWSINSYVFKNSGIETIHLHDYISTVGQQAFQGCTSLTSVTIGNNPTDMITLSDYAFSGCSNLKTVKILRTNQSRLSSSSFGGDTALTDIYVSWSEGEVANAPWGATNATIHYNWTPTD